MPYSDLTGRKVGGSGVAFPPGTYNTTESSTFFGNGKPISSNGCRGISVMLAVTAAPNTADTLGIELDGYDPTTGLYYFLWSGVAQAGTAMQAAIGANGVFVTSCYALPGITNVASTKLNNILPEQFRIQAVENGSGSFTYTCSYDLIP